jgi:hypothetical protein
MMKSISRLLAASSLVLALFACSEGNYTPVTTPNASMQNQYPYGQNNLAPGFQTGYQNGVNPFFTQNGFGYNQLSAQAQLSFNLRANNNMYSCASRATPNYVYFQQSQMNNCVVRRVPTYTPSSCACAVGNCNCQEILDRARSQCGVVYYSNRDGSAAVGGSTTTTTGGGSTTGTTTGTGSSFTSNTLLLSITGADAAALYNRLAKVEEETNNSTKTKIRTGSNYKCMMGNKGKHDSDFACDIDLSVKDGVIFQMYPLGQPGSAEISNPELYSGPDVQIGGAGLNAYEGTIKIEGKAAEFTYQKLTSTETTGTIDIAQQTQATIKLGKNIKCYKTTGTASQVTECKIKVNATSGEVEAAN